MLSSLFQYFILICYGPYSSWKFLLLFVETLLLWLWLWLKYVQYSGTALLLLVNLRIPHQNNDNACPSYINYCLKRRRFVASNVQPVVQQYELTNNFCNQSSHYENYGWFPLQIKANTCIPQNQHFSWWAKMNGTLRRALVSSWRMYYMHSGVAKGTSQAETTSNSENSP